MSKSCIFIYIHEIVQLEPPHINVVFDVIYIQYINVKEIKYIYISTNWKNKCIYIVLYTYTNIYIYHINLYVKIKYNIISCGGSKCTLEKKVLSVLLFKRVLSDGSRNPTCLFTFSKGGSKCLSVAIITSPHESCTSCLKGLALFLLTGIVQRQQKVRMHVKVSRWI